MSATLQIDEPVAELRTRFRAPRHQAPRVAPLSVGQTSLAVFCVALALRIYHIATSYNIFIDEVLYSQVGDNVAHGRGLTLFDKPFDVHPPASFGVLGGVIDAFGLGGGTTAPDRLILALRPVAAVFGSLTVVAVMLMMRRIGASGAMIAAVTAIVAIDPFEISYDSRVMLEAFAQTFVVATIALLVVMAQRSESGGWRRHAVIVGAGVSAGLAAGTKETFGLVLAAVLILVTVCPRLMPRRAMYRVIGIGFATYLLLVGTAWLTSGFGPWWSTQTSGVRRLIGTEQTTGFNANVSHVTLTSRIFANVDQFGATYVILFAGGIATIVDLARRRPWRGLDVTTVDRARTIISIWNLAACGYLVYATLVGSIEEQMYYIPLVPCILSLGLGLSSICGRVRPRRIVGALCFVVLAFQASVWLDVHQTNNNLYEKFLNWQRSHVLAGSRIGVTDEPASFLVRNATVGAWPTITQLHAENADYVLVDSSLVEQGYSKMSSATLTDLIDHAPIAYQARSGSEVLYFFDLRGTY